jgi:hypothetical protein
VGLTRLALIDELQRKSSSMEPLHIPSGSQTLFPSSSNEANFARSEAAATINDVEGSKRILEYDRPRGTDREGKGPFSWKSGIHSNKLGPYEGASISIKRHDNNVTNLIGI